MTEPKFAIGEVVLVHSTMWDIRCEATVKEILSQGQCRMCPSTEGRNIMVLVSSEVAYVLDVVAPNGVDVWDESALRKKPGTPPSEEDIAFTEFMSFLKSPKYAPAKQKEKPAHA